MTHCKCQSVQKVNEKKEIRVYFRNYASKFWRITMPYHKCETIWFVDKKIFCCQMTKSLNSIRWATEFEIPIQKWWKKSYQNQISKLLKFLSVRYKYQWSRTHWFITIWMSTHISFYLVHIKKKKILNWKEILFMTTIYLTRTKRVFSLWIAKKRVESDSVSDFFFSPCCCGCCCVNSLVLKTKLFPSC